MKIALDCRFIGKSGIGTYIESVSNTLIKFHQENEYIIILEKGNNNFKDVKNVEVIEVDIKPFSIKELLFFPVKEINQCDAYFTPYINIPGGIRIPVYSTIHDVIFLDLPELTSFIGRMARRWFIGRAVGKSRAVFTVSNFSKERILHHFKTSKDIEITFSAISESIKKYATNNGTIIKEKYIIYVGNIKKHKGLKVLIEAYNNACAEGYDKHLMIVGDGDKMRTADKDIDILVKENEKIEFTGYVPNEELFGLIQKAEALVLPTFYEGFGLTPLEALYLGTDVVISDIQVLKEVYGHLPVTYFRVGDRDDLKEKLIGHSNVISNIELLRNQIDSLYNFRDITQKIIQKIES